MNICMSLESLLLLLAWGFKIGSFMMPQIAKEHWLLERANKSSCSMDFYGNSSDDKLCT